MEREDSSWLETLVILALDLIETFHSPSNQLFLVTVSCFCIKQSEFTFKRLQHVRKSYRNASDSPGVEKWSTRFPADKLHQHVELSCDKQELRVILQFFSNAWHHAWMSSKNHHKWNGERNKFEHCRFWPWFNLQICGVFIKFEK